MPTNCGLSSSESNRVRVRYQVEDPTCYGKLRTVGTTYTNEVRSNGLDFKVDKNTKVSEEIRADRMISGTFALGASSTSAVDFEFARGTIDDFIAAYVGKENWSKPMTMHLTRGTALAVTANNTITVQTKDLTNVIAANDHIKLEGWATPGNNSYFTVASIAFAAGVTTITTVETTLTVEAGSATSALMDANDVIVSGTTLQTNATGFNAGGATVFAAPRAAGLLEPGRVIYAQGLGLEEGTLTFAGLPTNAETFVVADGTGNSVTFEYVTTAGTGLPNTREIVIGATANATGTATEAAIMKALNDGALKCSASFNPTGSVLTVRNLNRLGGGSLTGTVTNVTIAAFAGGDATVNGYFTILSATDTQLNVSPAPTTNTNAAAKLVVLKGSHVAPPSDPTQIEKIAFQLEREHTDINEVFLFKGQRVESIEMDFSANDLVSGKVSFMGSEVTNGTQTVLGAAPHVQRAALTSPVYNSTANLKDITRNGAPMPAAVMSLKLNMATNLRKQSKLGAYWNVGVGQGRLDVKATLDIYFQNATMYNDFINNTEFGIDVTVEDTDSWAYVISLPRVFPATESLNGIGGIDEDVMETIETTANIDTNLSQTEIVFSRFSSTTPPTA